jgi:tetraacyldisaccharide 4'-kinase
MPIKTPSFWTKKGFFSTLLLPLSSLYYMGHKINNAVKTPYAPPIPTLCIGGIVSGGSGKTPVLQALLPLLKDNAITQSPVIVMRGYGGRNRSPHRVSLASDTWKNVGDEALLHARNCPVIVAKNRKKGVEYVVRNNLSDLVLLDDGLQNNSVTKTLSFLVLESDYGLGNGYMIPAGPLREPWSDAIDKADAVILIGHGNFIPQTDKPVFKASRMMKTSHLNKGLSYFGFAGIGRPSKFKDGLVESGLDINGFEGFPDHHPYTASDLRHLLDRANGRHLITTEKDYVRLPNDFKQNISTVPLVMAFDQPARLVSFIKERLSCVKP